MHLKWPHVAPQALLRDSSSHFPLTDSRGLCCKTVVFMIYGFEIKNTTISFQEKGSTEEGPNPTTVSCNHCRVELLV